VYKVTTDQNNITVDGEKFLQKLAGQMVIVAGLL
jgi:hypothetical protein